MLARLGDVPGYERELGPLGLQPKLSPDNLLVDGDFAFDRLGPVRDLAWLGQQQMHQPPIQLGGRIEPRWPHMRVSRAMTGGMAGFFF